MEYTGTDLQDAVELDGCTLFQDCKFIDFNLTNYTLIRKWGTVEFKDCVFDHGMFYNADIREDFHFFNCSFSHIVFTGAKWGQNMWIMRSSFANCMDSNVFTHAAAIWTLGSTTTPQSPSTGAGVQGTPAAGVNYQLSSPAPTYTWTTPSGSPWGLHEDETPEKPAVVEDLYGPDDCRTCGHTGEKRKMCMWCTRCHKLIWGI